MGIELSEYKFTREKERAPAQGSQLREGINPFKKVPIIATEGRKKSMLYAFK